MKSRENKKDSNQRNSEEKNSVGEIPGMKIDPKYVEEKPLLPENIGQAKREMEKLKKELEKLKNFILKKYPKTQAIGILPKQAVKLFIDEEIGENLPEEQERKLREKIHLYVIVPEEKAKDIHELKMKIIEEIDKTKQNVWVYVKSVKDIWDMGLDSKFELVEAISMSFPLHDKGILGALRVAQIHKSLVIRKFEKYVVSYVIGGSLVTGEAKKTSDVDVFVIINDTDVKRMPRLELLERLRAIIYQYVAEASVLAGVKNKLEPQVYLLTDFWESVKDAHPVMFTFIRDGIPLYDRGTFLPWKALLKMGRLKPSPEAIDMFMSMGDKALSRAKRALLDIMIHDIYWGVLTPSQALLMLYGLPPPTPKHTPAEFKKIFVDKEKMLEPKYANILKEIVQIYKDYEHEKIKEIEGTEVDRHLKNSEEYLKRLKELREQIEQRNQEKTLEQIYSDVFQLLETIVGKKPKDKMIEEFEKKFVKKGKLAPLDLRILKEVVSAKKQFKQKKLNSYKVDSVRKNAMILINDLIEYNQRCELVNSLSKMKKDESKKL